MEAFPADFWRRRAGWTALRHNAACVLVEFLPWALGVSAAFACGLLIARQNGAAGSAAWLAYGAGLLACVEIALRRSRGRFFTARDAMVRLEWRLGLHNRLSSASDGIGDFPAARPAPDGFAIRWRKIVLPLAGASATVLAANWIPVSRAVPVYRPPTTPIAWTQTAGWVDALKKSNALQDPPVEELRERLEQLRKQPAEDWYSQSSLEAGDNLHGQTERSIQALQRDLESASNSLGEMERFSDTTSAAEMKSAHENMANALKGLAMGNLPLNNDLLNQLKTADLSNLKGLSQSQLDALKSRMKAGEKAAADCLHPGEMKSRQQQVASSARSGQPGDGLGKPGGPGGPGGGKSSAPLNLHDKPEDLGTTTTAPVVSNDLEHALPGDVMGVGKGEHQVDPSKYTGPVSAGPIASNGDGGEAVWRNDLTPKEREALKNFFK